MRQHQKNYATAGANETVVVYDDYQQFASSVAGLSSRSSVIVRFLLDQAVTFVIKWAPDRDAGDSALGICNGASQTGETVAAGTFFEREVRLGPGRNQVSVVMGATPPTSNRIATEINTFAGVVR